MEETRKGVPVVATETQAEPRTGSSSLVLVSNRLPVDRVETADGRVEWRRSPGGLVTALEPVIAQSGGVWIGWPGSTDVDVAPFTVDAAHGGSGYQLYPVGLSEQEFVEYYEGFSNGTLWPLFHDVIATPKYHRAWWDAYVAINQRFADAVISQAAPGATVWVHDYQLLLVPAMIRSQRPDVRIGFFLHIPFPSFGIFAQLPWRSQIVAGVLGADVVGVQRQADARNLLGVVRRLLGYRTKNGRAFVPAREGEAARQPIIQAYPISIDGKEFDALARTAAVQNRAAEIRRELGNPKRILLGVDRLDYTKGIVHRIKAFGELLEEGRLNPAEVSLIQVAVPSRERVESYRALRDEIELLVTRINGDFGTLGHNPISYLHKGYPRDEMASLYLASDVMLVTALRDGMNLVAKEYVATRIDNRGALVLSEFAGAADELNQALLINPHDIDGLKDTILAAIRMSPREQARRMRPMRRHIAADDVSHWSSRFLRDLAAVSRESGQATA